MSANFELHHDDDTTSSYDEVGQMMAWENSELDNEETIELFQRLLDSGLVWQLQGSYARAAQQLLQRGLIKRA